MQTRILNAWRGAVLFHNLNLSQEKTDFNPQIRVRPAFPENEINPPFLPAQMEGKFSHGRSLGPSPSVFLSVSTEGIIAFFRPDNRSNWRPSSGD